jgi:hypothetical protein
MSLACLFAEYQEAAHTLVHSHLRRSGTKWANRGTRKTSDTQRTVCVCECVGKSVVTSLQIQSKLQA